MANKKQYGAALITALLLTAIAASIATLMFVQQRVGIQETELMASSTRAITYMDGALFWANGTLKQDTRKIAKKKVPIYPKKMESGSFQGYKIEATLSDLQGLFNINSISKSPAQEATFSRLLKIVAPNLTANQVARLVQNVKEWLTPSTADALYEKLSPPYLAAHQSMTSISELRLVAGFTAKLYRKILPFVSALPSSVYTVDVNSAPKEVLAALSDKMTLNKAQEIAEIRFGQKGFLTTDDFLKTLVSVGIQDKNIVKNIVAIGSYFLLTSTAQHDKIKYILYTKIHRELDSKNNTAKATIIQQTQSAL